MYKKLVFSLSLIAAFPFCYTMEPNEVAMQLTDVEGRIFNLNQEQLDAFKQCAIFTDYQDNILKDEAAEIDIANQSKIWSFADCTNSELKADYICKLMDLISDKFVVLRNEESANVFALSLYMGAPEHKIQKLAEKFYYYLQTNKELLKKHANFKNYEQLEKAAIKYLPYYPDMHAFIEDFNMRYVKNGHPVGWEDLLKKTTGNFHCLDLSLGNLQKLGFIKKIYSLKGIEEFSRHLNCKYINTIKCDYQRISDFSINKLQKTFPNLRTLLLKQNIVKRLHKKQFENLSNSFNLDLDNNYIEKIDENCFSLIKEANFCLKINTVSREQFTNIYFPSKKIKNIAITIGSAGTCTAIAIAIGLISSAVTEILSEPLFFKLFKTPPNSKNRKLIFVDIADIATFVGVYCPTAFYSLYKLSNNLLAKSSRAGHITYSEPHSYIHCSNGKISYYYTSDKPYFS